MMILKVVKYNNNNQNINIKIHNSLNNKLLVLMEIIHLILHKYNQLMMLIKIHN